MVNVLRKYQQPVMIFITVVIIIAFVVFFQPGSRSGRNTPENGLRIYGRKYSNEELQRRARCYSVAMYAGLNELVLGLTMGNPYSNQAGSDFLFNGFVLDHEANNLGITVDDSEVENLIEKLAPFQTNGAFDRIKYVEFEQKILRPNGFTAKQLEDLVRNQLRLTKLMALVGSTVEVTPGEFRAQYIQEYQKMNAAVIRFNLADFAATIQPTDAEIEKFFKDREASYKAPEKRVVSYVKLTLSDAEKALKGKELMDARQALANRVNNLSQDLLQENAKFAEVAKEYTVEVKTTPEFSEAQPPAELASVAKAAAATFNLTEKAPLSDPLSAGDGYCILHLDKVTPARQLTFAEARPQVVQELKTERGNMALTSKANEVRAKIAEAMKSGKSFADAAKAADAKVETLPPFSLTEPLEKTPDFREILTKAVELADGEASDFLPTASGGMIVYLDKRNPIDEERFEKDRGAKLLATRSQKSMFAFMEWMQSRRKYANIQG